MKRTRAMQEAQVGARERALEAGIESLGDDDLVALVLGTGARDHPVGVVAAELLAEMGGVDGLSRAGIGALAAHAGIGFAKGARLAAAVELGRRAAAAAVRGPSLRLPDSEAVHAWARPRLVPLDHEELWILALDGHHHVRAARRVASGGLHGMSVASRDPLRVALREAASAFVLVHNHPSGDPTPSEEDVSFSRALAKACATVGTPMLDHVVVARRGHVSMLDRGMLSTRAGHAG